MVLESLGKKIGGKVGWKRNESINLVRKVSPERACCFLFLLFYPGFLLIFGPVYRWGGVIGDCWV